MRLIDADALIQEAYRIVTETNNEAIHIDCIVDELVGNAPTVDAVPVELFNALKNLVNGDWVDSELVEKALGIDFSAGFKMFDFARTAEWNPAPLNGQKITIKFARCNAITTKSIFKACYVIIKQICKSIIQLFNTR